MSTSVSSNPDSPDSMSMPMSSPASVTLSPQSMENILGVTMDDRVANNVTIDGEPYLVIREQPLEKYRFRYKSEMMGSHGCMLGKSSDKRRKYYPSVELMNFNGTGVIRCSLYSAQKNEALRTLHCHRLVIRVGREEVDDPHHIPVNPSTGYLAVFRGMGIIHTAKKHIADELVRKNRHRLLEILRAKNINVTGLSQNEEVKIRAEAEHQAKTINLNVVTLGFEACVYDSNGVLVPICKPVFSDYICNMKSALTGELKICRIDRHFSTCVGGDEVWMLVEKVGKKNIKVRFFELDDDDNEIWSDYARFSELDVHHQYAIVFRTPPYRSSTIEEPQDVLVQLFRPTDGACSEPIKFTYKPSENFLEGSRKRARRLSGDLNNFPMENGFTLPPTNLLKELSMGSSDPILPLCDASPRPEMDLLQEINLLSSNSTTFEQILREEEGMASAEFKEFMRNVSLDSYFGTYTSESMDLVTDSVKSKKKKQALEKVPVTSADVSKAVEGEKKTVETATRQLSGDHLLKIVMRRLLYLMNTTSSAASTKQVAEGVRDLFEKRSSDGDTAVHVAVQPENKQYLEKILSIITESRTIDSTSVQVYITDVLDKRNKKQETPLHLAVMYNNPKAVSSLLRCGASVNVSDISGYTPLHIAVQNSHIQCLKELLNPSNYKNSNVKVHLNVKSEDGYSPLHLATRKKNLAAVMALVLAGADINEGDQSYGRTPIHIAVEEESADILEYLCGRPDIRVDETNFDGNTALHLACAYGFVDLCRILLDSKANPRIPNLKQRNTEEDTGLDEIKFVAVKEEYDLQEGVGQTAFDLAADNDEVLDQLRTYELSKAAEDSLTEPINIKKEVEENYDLPTPKEEPLTLTEMFDADTLSDLCAVLDRSQGWRRLAQLLDYSFLLASIGDTQSPSKTLFNYVDLHGSISMDEVRSHLQILDENEAVAVIDEMLTRRFLASNS